MRTPTLPQEGLLAQQRALLAIAALPPAQGRALIICAVAAKGRGREHLIARYQRSRSRVARSFKAALVRVLKFAKHETLRKLHRYMFQNRPLKGAAEDPNHPDANKIAFSIDELRADLLRMLQSELPGALESISQDVLESIGFRDPWKLPAQATLDMVARRQNLLSGVPDEIFSTIQSEISAGLNAGESIAQLANRITDAFDEIIKGRAEVIAQTETAAAYGFAGDAAARAAGVPYKQWIHSGLPLHPRPDHLAIDRLIVPIDEPYPVGDPPLMYPHDPNGAAGDVINCGCISIPVLEEDYRAQQEAA